MCLGLFAVSLVVWTWAFVIALARTARGDDVVVGSLFLVQGPVPSAVRRHLFGALTVCLAITAATAASEPFGVLVPMLPLGFAGLWGARYGTFPPRRTSGPGRSTEWPKRRMSASTSTPVRIAASSSPPTSRTIPNWAKDVK